MQNGRRAIEGEDEEGGRRSITTQRGQRDAGHMYFCTTIINILTCIISHVFYLHHNTLLLGPGRG